MASPGYTLPVFACASAIAALLHLKQKNNYSELENVSVDLIEPAQTVEIPIEQVAKIGDNKALAITISDPGEHLDLTRNTPVWAIVEISSQRSAFSHQLSAVSCQQSEEPYLNKFPCPPAPLLPGSQSPQIKIEGGEGIGKQIDNEGQSAIYSYARRLISENLQKLLEPAEIVAVTIILPEGKKLAQRTSNSAFGVVEGLSLLGTTGIVQPLTAPEQLEAYQQELKDKAKKYDRLVFCVGENGLDLAKQMGINPEQIVKTANWIGSMLATAGSLKIQSILLFGYHGKLIKLAGGIFHTHHHLADARLEILTANCASLGLPNSIIQQLFNCQTTDDALKMLRSFDLENNSNWVDRVYGAIANKIDRRSQDYIRKHTEQEILVGSLLFDRDREIIIKSLNGTKILDKLC
jgi:cobalt-precorrin-5B (C1)-methyltransferase